MTAYSYWKAGMAGKAPTATVDEPHPGFYRLKRHGLWIPVAVWPSGASLGFKIGKEIVGELVGTEQWPYYATNFISEAEYRKVAEKGGEWSDADPTVAAMTKEPPSKAPPERDPTAFLREQVAAALRGVAAYDKVESDEQNVKAAGLRNLLLQLSGDADKARDAEKRPHLDAGRAIDAKWRDVIQDAKTGSMTVRRAMEAWEDVKREAAQSAARRAAEAAPHEAPPPASNLPPPQVQVRPTYGKAASVGSRLEVTTIDWDKFLADLRQRPEWGAVANQLWDLAEKLANKGIMIAGVSTAEKASIR
jgi:hypothetical protein